MDFEYAQGQIVEFTLIQIYDNVHDIFLLPRDITITKTYYYKFKNEYNPDKIVQVFYKKIQITTSNLII